MSPEKSPGNTIDRVVSYYRRSHYLEGPLQGASHFGFTEEGEPFRLYKSLRKMEHLLGDALSLPAGSTVLDAGCGYGRVATTLAGPNFGLNIIGIDLVPERIEEARRYTKEHGVADRVNLIQGDYTHLPLEDSSVDGVFTMETLVHADPLEKALSEFWRVLKPGGKVVLFEYSVPDYKSLDSIRRRITDSMVDRTGMTSISRFTHNAFPQILTDANFADINIRDISRNVWPIWGWLFRRAIRENGFSIVSKTLRGKKTNVAGSLLIWPYRSQLGYNVVSAVKPL